MPEHKLHDREDGLAHCMVCGGAEGSMPTDCPGAMMTAEQQRAVYDGRLNYALRSWWVPLAPSGVSAIRAIEDLTGKERAALADGHIPCAVAAGVSLPLPSASDGSTR